MPKMNPAERIAIRLEVLEEILSLAQDGENLRFVDVALIEARISALKMVASGIAATTRAPKRADGEYPHLPAARAAKAAKRAGNA